MSNFSLHGLGIALITPFLQDKSIDFKSLAEIIDRLIGAKVDYLVVLGTTGEAATLTSGERAEVRAFVAGHVAGRIPLVLGHGGNCTSALVEDLRSMDTTGYSAILSVVPYYNKPSQEGIYRHYSRLAEVSPLPLVLYNVPGRTGVNMTADTTLRLSHDHKNIIGIKEASGNISQVEEIIRRKDPEFEVVSGDDALAFPFICMGAVGIISVMGNAYPSRFGRLVRYALSGQLKEARRLQREFDTMYRLLFADGNPAGIKCLLNCQGLINNELRLPLVPCSKDIQAKLAIAAREITDD